MAISKANSVQIRTFSSAVLLTLLVLSSFSHAQDLGKWSALPADWNGASVSNGTATLSADKWSYLVSPDEQTQARLSATVTITEPARHFRYFGEGWSAWPDPTFGDAGFEAALLLRSGATQLQEASGYRVQLSHKYQSLALIKFPEGGYVQVVPCAVKLKEPHQLQATVNGNQIVVSLDGAEKIRWTDKFLPIAKGRFGIGVSSLSKVTFQDVSLQEIAATVGPSSIPHLPKFSVRVFLGDRKWIFDGDEPILELHNERDPSCFAKLKPGYKPQITFDSHWGLENQGAFPDAASKWTDPVVEGGGKSIQAHWSARNVKDRFTTKSQLTVGFDSQRGTYTYEIQSELEVLPGEPFHFRYGFDFEHHTPLDPFRWQYLIVRRKNHELYHRPVYPIDPGPQNDLESYHGLRVWYGRHFDQMQVAPAIEYTINPEWHRTPKDDSKLVPRKLNTAVCAAFYDTGVSFEPETALPGTKLKVQYRYTGYPATEAEKLFQQSKIYDSPTLDPNHHYIFADEWPKLTFSQFVPMSQTWIYGRSPFMTNHNTRPTYELVKNCGAGSGFAMKLGPASFGKGSLPVKSSLTRGRWIVSALVKSVNAHGPGGRIELEATQAKTNKVLAKATHFVGNGTFDWRRQGFVFDVPEDAGGLSIAFGNSGTGEMQVTDVEFRRLDDNEPIPAGIAQRPNDQPPSYGNSPEGAIADYRMQEGAGYFVLNNASGRVTSAGNSSTVPLGHLDLANLEWVVDSGRPALRFAENLTQKKDYRTDSSLSRQYLGHPSYVGKDTLPVAVSGHHGGGGVMKGLTLGVWVKPAAQMGKGDHQGKGDIIGYGARRFILGLHGQTAPYQLVTRINVNDIIPSDAKLDADQWAHVAMTAEPAEGQWRVKIYKNGQAVGEGLTKKFPADSVIPPSLILGAEIFYLHDAYYRGLIGHTLVFDRTLSAEEIAGLAK